MTEEERGALGDLFARRIVAKAPMTLDELASEILSVAEPGDALPIEKVFAVAEAGQIRWSPDTAGLPRNVRFVVAYGREKPPGFDLLVSTRPPSSDRDAFLQVAAWDSSAGAFQFYGRAGAKWFWEGSSWHALAPPTRGAGAFDSHVNGAPVMKELKAPWLHWHSVRQGIPLESFPEDHPVRSDAFFARVQSADILETSVVRPQIARWTRSRLDRELGEPGGVRDPSALLRHLTSTTTVNVRSSAIHARGTDPEIALPLSLFIDSDMLIDRLDLKVRSDAQPIVRREHYQAALDSLGVCLRDGRSGFEQSGDAFFAWASLERAEEDQAVVTGLMSRAVLSEEFVISVLLVDYPTPIDSRRRDALLALAPVGPVPPAEIEPRMRAAIADAAGRTGPGSPEREAADYLSLDPVALRNRAGEALDGLLDALRARAATADGVVDLMRLADSRRRSFRRRKLAEFDLTLPFGRVADGGSPSLELRADGSVAPRFDARPTEKSS